MPRNPAWSRDELILALELYFRVNPGNIDSNHSEIIALSKLLNALPIHPERADAEAYRNANGVSMKLSNFLRFDPNYIGKGLERGGKLEEIIWNEFANDIPRLKATAQAIKDSYKEVKTTDSDFNALIDEDEEFTEGRILTAIHKRRERNPTLVRKKKVVVMREFGRLACEVCGFDFAKTYGELGEDFAECHHRLPLATLSKETKTKLEDLVILCANCHRMIHKSKLTISVEELNLIIRNKKL